LARAALHRVDTYARDVVAGRIIAGPYVRLACARHQRDRADGQARGLRFNRDAADHAIRFIEQWVNLPDVVDAHGAPVPFRLQPWQAFIVGSLFGWEWVATGHRRFRNAFIEVGKGNGKTPLLAAIGLYGLMADGQTAPEIYSVAADRDQAMVMFRDAVRMVDASPELAARVHKTGIEHVHNMSYGLGLFRPFSREQGAKSGKRPHMGLIDELHEHPNAEATAMVRAGAKGNHNAMFPEITNSGFDRSSICWQHHEHSIRVVERTVDDDRWFAYVCALDDGDDPLTDRACHLKANPNLGISIHPAYLADQVDTARNIPAETNTVLRLNFCQWTGAHTPAWDMDKWRTAPLAGAWPLASELVGRPCYGGLDLGLNDDFAAWARVWVLADGTLAVAVRFWLPASALVKYPKRPYAEWQRDHLLTVTDGDTTDLDIVEQTVIDDARASGVKEIAYDKRFASQLALHLQGAGLTVVDTPQGFALNESIKSLSKAIADGTIRHGHNRLLTWQMDNTVLRSGRNGEQRLDKETAREKIDGPSALVMANARRIAQPLDDEPTYQVLVFGG
jgi:phage terminase large subunit-like protein